MSYDRPLTGEPLALDLLNTAWVVRGAPVDMLDELDGVRAWLDEHDLRQPVNERARTALVTARDAIRAHIADGSRAALNEVLDWGRHRHRLTADGPETSADVEPSCRLAGWLAAVNYLELCSADASRIRHCAHPDCVLHFYDTSAKRSRRWCSMAVCGNRAKAARHYARSKSS